MDSSTLRTREQIDALKANWRADPCWDIEDTPGFELNRLELVEYHLEMKRRWDAAAARREALEGKRPFIKLGDRYYHLARIDAVVPRTADDGSAYLKIYCGSETFHVIDRAEKARLIKWLDTLSYDLENEE